MEAARPSRWTATTDLRIGLNWHGFSRTAPKRQSLLLCESKNRTIPALFTTRRSTSLTHTYLGGYTSINSQQVIDPKCRTLTMCSSERSPIRLGGLSSDDCAAKES